MLGCWAIHIEIAHSLDVFSFIQALRRFVARRGNIKEIWTDNASNFIGAERKLGEAIENWNQTKYLPFYSGSVLSGNLMYLSLRIMEEYGSDKFVQ